MKIRDSAPARFCACCLFLLATGEARSGDTDIYESLPEVAIGKVFFTPQQRERLDLRRTSIPAASSVAPKQAQKKDSDDAAGYIVSSKGVSKVYADGEFVPASDSSAVTFPGTVNIARGERPDDAEADDVAD